MGHLRHDKVEISGLGRLVKVVAFNNLNYKLDPGCHNNIIYVIIDADGVNSNDNYIAKNIIKQN